MNKSCHPYNIKSLTPESARELLELKDVLFLDVREPHEYLSGHIKGSMHIPINELQQRIQDIPTEKKIVTYCRSGNRSLKAAIFLCSKGFKDIMHLEGGILKWEYGLESFLL